MLSWVCDWGLITLITSKQRMESSNLNPFEIFRACFLQQPDHRGINLDQQNVNFHRAKSHAIEGLDCPGPGWHHTDTLLVVLNYK